MTALISCPACVDGDHANHQEVVEAIPDHLLEQGFVGGKICPCRGECADGRYQPKSPTFERRTYRDVDAYETDVGEIVIDRGSHLPWRQRYITLLPHEVTDMARRTNSRKLPVQRTARDRAEKLWGADPDKWPSWPCGECGQVNSGYAMECGRCKGGRDL